MDVLDKYKKAWNDDKQYEDVKVSRNDIFKMMHSSSSSVSKWILIIGLLEFVSLIVSYFFVDHKENLKISKEIGLSNLVEYFEVFVLVIFSFFIYQFYKNYKKISVIDDTKALMKNILNTRKSVKMYVLFNLIIITIISLTYSIATTIKMQGELNSEKLYVTIALMIGFSLILVGIAWGIYQLLYGFLLKKLQTNYKELTKL